MIPAVGLVQLQFELALPTTGSFPDYLNFGF